MPTKPSEEEKQLSEIAKRLLTMPHKPRGESKLGKRTAKAKKSPKAKKKPSR